MKRIFSLTLVAILLLSSFSLFACGTATAPEGTVTRITVDINPSVEFMVDDENKVVSVTALNDDGSILIAGEAFVGKTPEEAVELTVQLATETGYLVKGNAEADENTVKISVSGDTKYAKQLCEDVTAKAEAVLEKLDVAGKIEKVEALKKEALIAMAVDTALVTESEAAEMSEEDLYKIISAGRIETALLLTEEMRQAYYTAKEHKISFAQREETAKVIEAMGGIYNLVHIGYKAALDAYSSAILAIDEFRYDTLVSPESEYQKSLAALRDAKTELLKQKTYTASLTVGGEEYAAATLQLQLSEENYEKALAAYEKLGELANKALEDLVAALREAETYLIGLEESFSDDIKAELTAKAQDIEDAMNEYKDRFFEEFEEAHRDDILAMEESLKAKKQELIDSVGKTED